MNMLPRVGLSSSKALVWQGSQKAALKDKHQFGQEGSSPSHPEKVRDPHMACS